MLATAFTALAVFTTAGQHVSAVAAASGGGGSTSAGTSTVKSTGKGHVCGSGADAYKPAIDLGCQGKGNPIADASFAIIRFLSDGVGLVVVASLIWGGILYTASQGNPQDTAKAVTRIRSSIIALLVFLFGYAILNYLIPGQFLQ